MRYLIGEYGTGQVTTYRWGQASVIALIEETQADSLGITEEVVDFIIGIKLKVNEKTRRL
ncbi:hypothetical protein ACFLVP_01045 [Chloroflexota bacterium]